MIRREIAEYLNSDASPSRTLDHILGILDALRDIDQGVTLTFEQAAEPTAAIHDPDKPF